MLRPAYWALFALAYVYLLALVFIANVYAAEEEPDTSLVLLIDASGTIDDAEWATQASAYVEVLRHPDVVAALSSTQVAVIYFGQDAELICPFGSAVAAADCIAASDRNAVDNDGTCPGKGLYIAGQLAERHPTPRLVIDVSGDGPDNCYNDAPVHGLINPLPINISALLEEEYGAEINGLVVRADAWGNLVEWYERNIVSSFGFVLEVDTFGEMVSALRAKIILEVAGSPCVLRGAV